MNENLSSIPRTHVKNRGLVVPPCNACPVEMGKSLGLASHLPDYISGSQVPGRDPVFKSKENNA